MKRRGVWKVVIATGFAVILLAGAWANLTAHQPPGTVRLKDGSLARLGAVSFGVNHRHDLGVDGAEGWRWNIAQKMPGRWFEPMDFRWRPLQGALGVARPDGMTGLSLATFVSCLPTDTNSFRRVRAVVEDEAGNIVDAGSPAGTTQSGSLAKGALLHGWSLPAFPRRGSNLVLRCYELSAADNKWAKAAEFAFENPAPGPHPAWTPEALPASRFGSNFSVSLERLESGLAETDLSRRAEEFEGVATLARFRFGAEESMTGGWKPTRVEIEDATGNHWKPQMYLPDPGAEGGTASLAFLASLWPGEPAWRMKFEFVRDEVCVFENVACPNANEGELLNDERMLGVGGFSGAERSERLEDAISKEGRKTRPITVRLLGISTGRAPHPTKFQKISFPDAPTAAGYVKISVQVSMHLGLDGAQRFRLANVTDEMGARLNFEELDLPPHMSSFRMFGVNASRATKRLSITFAFEERQSAEFMAKPEFPGSKPDSKQLEAE